MRNPYSISPLDEQTLRRWVAEHGVRSVLEFGAGRSTELFSECGCGGLSVESEQEHLPKSAPPLWNILLVRHSRDTAEHLGFGTEYDLGFIDGPGKPDHRWKRFWSLTAALPRCRLLAVHDSIRDAHLITLAIELGSVLLEEDRRERGLVLLKTGYPTT
jgi:hypothetical protein